MADQSGTPARNASREQDDDNVASGAEPRSAPEGGKRAKPKPGAELRELIQKNDQKLYDFCCYMLGPDDVTDEMLLGVFREYGEEYRRLSAGARRGAWEAMEARLRLFQIGWNRIAEALLRVQPSWVPGRDTRSMKGSDDDVIAAWRSSKRPDTVALRSIVVERIGRMDPEFRAPVVLRDVLGFEDEEAVRILGLRWGVYRHRLHRGRLECKDALRGRSMPAGARNG